METGDMLEIGVDCEEISRFRKVPFDGSPNFYRRIFTSGEIEYCLKFRDPYPHFTARFAAKEAAIKALGGCLSLALTDIEISNSEAGKPSLALSSSKTAGRRLYLKLSMTHSRHHAVAFVVASDSAAVCRSIYRRMETKRKR